MTRAERMAIKNVADKIIKVSKTKKDADDYIKKYLFKLTEVAMKAECDEWLRAANSLGPKTKEKLMKARFDNG